MGNLALWAVLAAVGLVVDHAAIAEAAKHYLARGADGPLVSRLAFGHNTVWSRGGLGVWDERLHQPVPEVERLVRQLRPSLLRFPGGSRALRYHFAETIGPVSSRKPQCDPFTGKFDDTSYGLDEFLSFAASTGAGAILVTPWVDGTPEEAAALVAYVNASPDSKVVLGRDGNGRDWGTAGDWARLRAKNGHPAPYGVRFIEIGNEQYLDMAVGPETSCGRPGRFRQNERWLAGKRIPTTARDYADGVRVTGRLIHEVDPKIQIGASAFSLYNFKDTASLVAPLDTTDAWNRTLVERGQDGFDFFVLHPYRFLESTLDPPLSEALRKTVHDLRALAPQKRIGVTEFGSFAYGGTLQDGLLTADILRVVMEEGLLLCLRHILVEDHPGGLFARSAAILGPTHELTPGFFAEELLANSLRGRSFPLHPNDPGISAFGAQDGDHLTFVVIQHHRAGVGEHAVLLPLPPGKWHGLASAIAGPSLNTKAADIRRESFPVSGSGTLSIGSAPTSLTVVELNQ